MVISTQELRRRWSDKSNAAFHPSDRADTDETYPAEDYEREFDFKGCRSIVFLKGQRTGDESDVLLLAQGTGHMTLPAGIQVLVNSGYVKCEPVAGRGGGIRAPPNSRVGSEVGSSYSRASGGYAPGRVGGGSQVSGYSGGGGIRRAMTMPSPPRDGASFSRVGSSRDSYVSARGVPLPASVGGGSQGDWFVEAEMDGDDDKCSIAPSESISSVGSRRGGRSAFY